MPTNPTHLKAGPDGETIAIKPIRKPLAARRAVEGAACGHQVLDHGRVALPRGSGRWHAGPGPRLARRRRHRASQRASGASASCRRHARLARARMHVCMCIYVRVSVVRLCLRPALVTDCLARRGATALLASHPPPTGTDAAASRLSGAWCSRTGQGKTQTTGHERREIFWQTMEFGCNSR